MAARFIDSSTLQAQNDTFFKGVTQVPAGHFLRVPLNGTPLRTGAPQIYWDYPADSDRPIGQADLVANIRETFLDAVRIRLRSDVPIGVLVSGGVDSSAIAAAMHQLSPDGETAMIAAVSDDPSDK